MLNYAHPWLFEVSWEIANKIGGIYTVLRTKAPVTVAEFGSRYCLVGPWNEKSSPLEVEVLEPESKLIRKCIDELSQHGIRVVYGRWLIDGSPYVLLFDLETASARLSEWRNDLWESAAIPCPTSDRDMNDAVLLGYMLSWFLDLFRMHGPSEAVILHCHEWMASVAAVLSNKRKRALAVIFTTHATLLGRYLCAGDADFYNNLQSFKVDDEAGKRGIYHRYCLERAAAHCADVFTTVSHITAYEAEYLLFRKPDGVLPNGLNVIKFNAMHEFQNLHAANKKRIHSFVQGHFYGHYDFDLNDTLYMFIAGRYEYRNKGVDMFLEAMARLNQRLRDSKCSKTVVAFIIMPAATNNYNVDTLQGQAVVKKLREVVSEVAESIKERLFDSALRGCIIDGGSILSSEDKVSLKRQLLAVKRSSLPPVVTHNMSEGYRDPILMEIRRLNLFNAAQDRVKIVYHPEFIDKNPILGMTYENFVRGCHLGVFPSYYEPWGYTPAECTVMGVPSVTSNLSGFGCFISEHVERPEDYGAYVIDRRLKSVEESVEQLTECLFNFCQKTQRQRINQRNRVERLSDLLDWRLLGEEYQKARYSALKILASKAGDLDSFVSNHSAHEIERDEELDRLARPLSAVPSPSKQERDIDGDIARIYQDKLKLHEQASFEDTNKLKVRTVV